MSDTEDFPRGPLSEYRSQATFDWKDFRNRFLTKDVVKWRQEIFSAMEKDPDFRRDNSAVMGLQQQRAKTFRQCVKALDLIDTEDPLERRSGHGFIMIVIKINQSNQTARLRP